MAKRKLVQTITKHTKVDFELDQYNRCVALAQLGMSSAFITEETGLSEGQIVYALTKAKRAEGYKSGHTYRTEWKNGTSSAARQMVSSVGTQLAEDARKRLPKLFERATAVVKED